MRTKKLDQVPGLDILPRKMSSAFEEIYRICKDLEETREDFVSSVNRMDIQIRTIRSFVDQERCSFDHIFREDDI